MRYVVTHGDEEHEVEVADTAEEGVFEVTVGGRTVTCDLRSAGGGAIHSLLLDGRSYELLVLDGNGKTSVIHHGQSVELAVESERERNARLIAAESGAAGSEVLTAVMPGFVVSVSVSDGDEVKKGDTLVILEAMKMENEIRAKSGGRVARIHVAPGQTVNAGDPLVEIEGDAP